MEQERIDRYKQWFVDYVAGFYGDDEYVNANIKLKEEHSLMVCDAMSYLTDALGLESNQRRIADAIAILHDLGRFPQFIKYRTYNDPRSVNHCLLSLEVMAETDILAGVEQGEKQIIEKAIELHGTRQLPDDLDGDCLLQSKLIRDADKLDIYRVITDYYRRYQQDPSTFKLELELPDRPEYSKFMVEAILAGKLIDYDVLQTWNDMKLLQLGWVYDVNFVATLERIKQCKYLEQIIDFLPKTDDIAKVAKKILNYVDSRLKQQQ